MKHPRPNLAARHPASPPAESSSPNSGRSTALVPLRLDGWTPARQALFLHVLAATGNVSAAAREVGMTRQSAYKLRARLQGEPFDHGWQAAFACGYDRLAEAALERALNGTEVPHYHKGELVGTHRKFDERLTMGLLHMRYGAPAQRRDPPRPALAYTENLKAMIDRVADGPETWAEELRTLEAREAAEARERKAESEENAAWEEDWDEDEDEWDEDEWDEDDWDEDDQPARSRFTPEEIEAGIIAHKRRIGVLPWKDPDED